MALTVLRDHDLGLPRRERISRDLRHLASSPVSAAPRAGPGIDRRLDVMRDPFAVRELRIRQPARVLPGRARYDIFDSGRTLLAVAAETAPRSVLQTMAALVPRTRTIGVRSASGEPVLTMVKRDSDWVADVTDPEG